MLDPDRPPRNNDRGLAANVIAAVVLTILAVPMLVFASCIPVVAVNAVVSDIRLAVGIVAILALAICVFLAYHADIPGLRIGYIMAAIEVVAFAAWLILSGTLS